MKQTRVSVFDRLINSETAGFSIGASKYDAIIQSVRRDLQNLLNTRKAPTPYIVDESEVLNESLANYGIDDFASFNPESDTDRKKLKKTLEGLIATYEPRLRDVKVKLLKNTDTLDFRIRFHIDAILCIEKRVMPVQFNSIMESSPPRFNIKEAHYE